MYKAKIRVLIAKHIITWPLVLCKRTWRSILELCRIYHSRNLLLLLIFNLVLFSSIRCGIVASVLSVCVSASSVTDSGRQALVAHLQQVKWAWRRRRPMTRSRRHMTSLRLFRTESVRRPEDSIAHAPTRCIHFRTNTIAAKTAETTTTTMNMMLSCCCCWRS